MDLMELTLLTYDYYACILGRLSRIPVTYSGRHVQTFFVKLISLNDEFKYTATISYR